MVATDTPYRVSSAVSIDNSEQKQRDKYEDQLNILFACRST